MACDWVTIDPGVACGPLLHTGDGSPTLQQSLENLLHSQLDEVILVPGHEADRILDKVDTRRVKVVIKAST